MGLLLSDFFVLLFSFSILNDRPFSIFSDRWSLKIENKNNSMKIYMQKFDHRSLIYGIVGTEERVLVRQGT